MTGDRRERRVSGLATSLFIGSAASAVTLAIVYALGGDPQVEGALIGVALVALGAGLVTIAHGLLPNETYAESREELGASDAEGEALEEDLARGKRITRRRLMTGSLVAAVGAMGAAALFPIRSLGPSPGIALLRTPWRGGARAVTEDGRLVRAEEVPLGGLVTMFPEGHAGSADAQAVLVRVRPGLLRPRAGRRDWSPRGLVAYSKVCTHAGCPVGLYQVESHQLLCPCHQSAFDVLDAAEPVFGPAAVALPQLPLAIDDGYVVARGDFSAPVGPAWWSRP